MKRALLTKFHLLFSVCVSFAPMAPTCSKSNGETVMLLTSKSFASGAKIPALHTCEGNEHSPHLAWQNLPSKTVSLALIMDDPDAPHGTFVHWVAWNIDPSANELRAHIDVKEPETLLVQGQNSAGNPGYMGPCPPSGEHRYFFKLYALDTKLNLPKTTTKDGLLAAMQGHILGQTELMGKYQKGQSK